jgi:hypothetical protein
MDVKGRMKDGTGRKKEEKGGRGTKGREREKRDVM